MKLIDICKNGKSWSQVSEEFYHEINYTKTRQIRIHSPLKRLLAWETEAKLNKNDNQVAFCEGLLTNNCKLFKRLFTETTNQLKEIIDDVEELRKSSGLEVFYENGKTTAIGTKILNILDYDAWRSSNKGIDHFENVDVKACIYCNLESNWVTENKVKIYTWDHYYEKSRYPFLAMCVSNLIPSCHTCNSTFKTTKQFSLNTHLHPYIDDYDNLCKMSVGGYLNANKFEINKVIFQAKMASTKLNLFNRDLDLESRYQSQDIFDQIKQLHAEKYSFEMKRPDEVAKLLKEPLSVIKTRWYQRMGIDFDRDEIKNKRIGKLKLDIAEQFGLI